MLKMPSDEAIKALSISLDQLEVLTRGMIARILIKARESQIELDLVED